MNDIYELDVLIEKKRAELIRLFEEKKIFDEKIVEKSQELDQLLNCLNNRLQKKAL
ncbi:MAG TPA: aspartyl-phosphate phosphatase Spo0E family protein [Halanaerobiales bacterium]|nr:aspartyl-phosphate phosphatase Spo0E family protein [Halanaerobiales bacterium]